MASRATQVRQRLPQDLQQPLCLCWLNFAGFYIDRRRSGFAFVFLFAELRHERQASQSVLLRFVGSGQHIHKAVLQRPCSDYRPGVGSPSSFFSPKSSSVRDFHWRGPKMRSTSAVYITSRFIRVSAITPSQVLLDDICSLLGGRAAEELFLGSAGRNVRRALEPCRGCRRGWWRRE